MMRFLARFFFPPARDVCHGCGSYKPVSLWDGETAWCAPCSVDEYARLVDAAPKLRVVGRRAG